jgi:hypothetical protein
LRPTPSWGCVPTRVGMVRAAVASFSSAASSPHPRGDGPRALLILREYLHGCWGCMKLTTLSSLNLLFEISMQIREKRLSPRPAPGRPLLPLSPKRTRFAQNHSLAVWLTPDLHRTHGRPSVQECRLRLKRPPSSSRMLARHLPFKSSTAFRALAPRASFRGTQSYRLAFERKI